MERPRATALGLAVAMLVTAPLVAGEPESFWPAWRGPLATGVAPEAEPPVRWSETENIRWKVEVPGRGAGSPIVWRDRVYLLTAVPLGVPKGEQHGGLLPDRPHQFLVIAYDRADGRVVWQHVAREEHPHEGAHPENGTWASGSPVTDGTHVYAYFGSRGLYCYDLEGQLIWEQDFGNKQMRREFGEGTSPALYKDTIVIVWDHLGDSFVVALDARTGNERWRVPRDEIDTWATRAIVEHAGRQQVVVGAMNRVVSYDLETGAVVWESEGLNHERDSVSRRRGRVRLSDEWVSGQQPQSRASRWGDG